MKQTEPTPNRLLQTAIRLVLQGAPFEVNLDTLTLRVGRHTLVKNGKLNGITDIGIQLDTEAQFFQTVDELFGDYHHSIPSEKNLRHPSRHFPALSLEELTDEDMLYGSIRSEAQIMLEAYILCQILLGFRWNEETMGKWFYQSKMHPELVLLREWFDPSSRYPIFEPTNQKTNPLTN